MEDVEKESEAGLSAPALVGKAGEALVAAELMRRGISVAYPAYDSGIDLLAYREPDFSRVVPIQVKARSGPGYNFQRSWFRIKGIVLVHVWHVVTQPEFYVFSSLQEVKDALGSHASTQAWTVLGGYSVTGGPGAANSELMKAHRDRWDRVLGQL